MKPTANTQDNVGSSQAKYETVKYDRRGQINSGDCSDLALSLGVLWNIPQSSRFFQLMVVQLRECDILEELSRSEHEIFLKNILVNKTYKSNIIVPTVGTTKIRDLLNSKNKA